jgi:hypothetical protein
MAKLRWALPSVIAVIALACAALLGAGDARGQSDDGTVVDVPPGDEYGDTDPSALTDFRGTLDPHGQWVDDPTYGTTWTPDASEVGSDFEPYDTAGSWDWSGGDYTWVSDYPWGWVCFHYGRWVFAGGRWLWIPGRQYAGAWVNWRFNDDGTGVIGWAPQSPGWGWYGGGAFGIGFASAEPWAFVGFGGLFGSGLSSRVVVGDAALPTLARSRPYVRAQPTLDRSAAPQTMAQTLTHGPPPSALGLDAARIPHPALGPGEQRARQLAHPSTAVPLGARPPSAHVVRSRPPAQRAAPTPRGGGGGLRGRR